MASDSILGTLRKKAKKSAGKAKSRERKRTARKQQRRRKIKQKKETTLDFAEDVGSIAGLSRPGRAARAVGRAARGAGRAATKTARAGERAAKKAEKGLDRIDAPDEGGGGMSFEMEPIFGDEPEPDDDEGDRDSFGLDF